jgi:hypothetical protein
MKNGIGYLPEDRKRDGIIGELSVRENIILALQVMKGFFRPISRAAAEKFADEYIAALNIKTASKDTPINLDGNWASESTSGTNMTASIEGDQISLYWRNADGSSSLYWAGTFITSLPSKEPFSCTAMMNVQEIATSPFASKDATKEFTYLDGKLSFQVTTMGIPVTFRLHRIDK